MLTPVGERTTVEEDNMILIPILQFSNFHIAKNIACGKAGFCIIGYI